MTRDEIPPPLPPSPVTVSRNAAEELLSNSNIMVRRFPRGRIGDWLGRTRSALTLLDVYSNRWGHIRKTRRYVLARHERRHSIRQRWAARRLAPLLGDLWANRVSCGLWVVMYACPNWPVLFFGWHWAPTLLVFASGIVGLSWFRWWEELVAHLDEAQAWRDVDEERDEDTARKFGESLAGPVYLWGWVLPPVSRWVFRWMNRRWRQRIERRQQGSH